MMEVGVCLEGLSTTQLPAASAGASFHVAIRSGKFLRGSRREGEGVAGLVNFSLTTLLVKAISAAFAISRTPQGAGIAAATVAPRDA